ncbi:hypothetical protein [Fictibacillus phosphorivorans]|uniref:hypothetical protein n=1 Tax=Fictibacillus phosphorivorans TaxID=1221500 RepID=UPI00203BD0D4|nr:hypothetical protein [Fictibacillus phosphorivorans]MCM3720295.1 hypothetical protein [Fictibacillus phosphorivorans]MCM3777985.1 hypothetical protein [Fictibacillus phosphorivorans]
MTRILLIGGDTVHQSILRHLFKQQPKGYGITIIVPSKEELVLENLPENNSISIVEDTIISFDPLQKMLLGFSGEIYRFDVISFDMNMKFSLFKQALVPIAENGTMLVKNTLQNTEFPFLFGAGDCVSVMDQTPENIRSREKQANVLWHNITRYVKGQKLLSVTNGSPRSFRSWMDRLFKRV